jgi:hypothetical protein
VPGLITLATAGSQPGGGGIGGLSRAAPDAKITRAPP